MSRISLATLVKPFPNLFFITFFITVFILATASVPPAPAAGGETNAVIFMYHRFGEDEYPSTNVRLDQFEAHLEYLEANGFNVWPLEKVVEHLRNNRPMPDRTVAITIDDAYDSVYREAYPRLKERGWPFAVFVSTGPVDRGFASIMTWDQLREMAENGATIANHGVEHGHMADIRPGETKGEWLERVREEIGAAQERIKTEIGAAPMLFAYPYGEYDRDLAILVAELGYTAFGQQSGAAGPYSDPRAYPRYPLAEAYSELKDFAVKAKSLALPVRLVRPWDPVLPDGERRPVLEVELADNEARLSRLACFVTSQGKVPVKWDGPDRSRFTVQAPEPLGRGRARYNCTAPSKEPGRYYWYSHVWVIQ